MIIGMLGALVGVGLFVFGFVLGKEMTKPKEEKAAAPDLSDEEQQIRLEERRKLIAEQQAFNDLINYNADIAYKIVPSGE